jgi:hypothetical protein
MILMAPTGTGASGRSWPAGACTPGPGWVRALVRELGLVACQPGSWHQSHGHAPVTVRSAAARHAVYRCPGAADDRPPLGQGPVLGEDHGHVPPLDHLVEDA